MAGEMTPEQEAKIRESVSLGYKVGNIDAAQMLGTIAALRARVAEVGRENAALLRQYNDQLTRVSVADAATTRMRYEKEDAKAKHDAAERRAEEQRKALEAVVMFSRADGWWDGAKYQQWRELTGTSEVTAKALGGVARAALAPTPAPPTCWWDAPPPCPLHGASVFLCPEATARA
jgi:hypothetical protein